MPVEIPDKWKKIVRKILMAVDYDNIAIRNRARLDWDATFPHSFSCDLFLAIGNELKDPDIEGVKKEMKEPGVTYEFFFHHENRIIYTKICLSPDEQDIIIYSAHPPLKGEDL
jgi:hypothetical protein